MLTLRALTRAVMPRHLAMTKGRGNNHRPAFHATRQWVVGATITTIRSRFFHLHHVDACGFVQGFDSVSRLRGTRIFSVRFISDLTVQRGGTT